MVFGKWTDLSNVWSYLQEKGLTPNSIHRDMSTTLGKDASYYGTVKRRTAEFKRGRESLENDARP